MLAVAKREKFKSISESIVQSRKNAIKKAVKNNPNFAKEVSNAIVK